MKILEGPFVFLLAILCFGCTSYYQREVKLAINSEPPNAKIYDEGKFIGNAPLTLSFQYEVHNQLGVYYILSSDPAVKALLRQKSFTALKDGFEPQTKFFRFTSPYQAEFEKGPSAMGIDQGAFFDKLEFFLNFLLEPQQAKPQQQQQQQQQQTTIVMPAAGGAAKTLGSLTILSTPTQAEIFIDGSFVATTPVSGLQIETGPHKIEILKKGYKTWSRTMQVLSNSPVKLEVELELEKI